MKLNMLTPPRVKAPSATTWKMKVVSRRNRRPLVGAHYYPWYRAGPDTHHWNENTLYATVTDMPIQGPYSSNDERTISRHLKWIRQAGLDFLVVNLQLSCDGLAGDELESVDLLFEAAAIENPELRLSLMLSCDNADSDSIENALRHVEDTYVRRGNYLKIQSKPVLWFFISESFIGHFFHRFSTLREATRNYHRIAASGFCYSKDLPLHYSEYFDGWTLYSPLILTLN